MANGKYVDGFVIPVPKKKTAEYRKMASTASRVWKKFGALDYKECIMDDPKPPFVTYTFSKMAKMKPSETVWFSFIVYKSRKHRDSVNKKVMAYFEKKYGKDMPMPFDMKRFAYGGFKVMVSI
ncbi:MAG TPA: DUF1428 domain-containing protein [Flavobacteriales bacterium]|nr:DUF1428 domain-containing protein [Flavobacteriales bacterium]